MLPGAALLVGASAAPILDYALGKPFDLWGKSIDVSQTPQLRDVAYSANLDAPNVLPSPDSILTAWRRGMIHDRVAAYALQLQGVAPPTLYRNPANYTEQDYQFMRQLWRRVSETSMSRPDPATVMRLSVQGRIDPQQFGRLWRNLDADHNLYGATIQADCQLPGAGDLLQMLRLGRIDRPEYERGMLALGWYNSRWRNVYERNTVVPGAAETLALHNRGAIDDATRDRWMYAGGYVDPQIRQAMTEFGRAIPGPADLVRFAVREVWNREAIERWGYDEEFPPEFQYWMNKQGLGWTDVFNVPTDAAPRSFSPASAYWVSHWQPMSPEQAYRAYGLFREDRIGRYQEIAPGLQPFTLSHLNDILKIADYPPEVRKWLAAIASLPLRLTDIRQSFMTGVKDRQWAVNQLLDRRYVREDADAAVDLWEAQKSSRLTAMVAQLERATSRATMKEILAGYADGFVPEAVATQRLLDLGIPADLSRRLLSLEDSRALRASLREALRALRRDYLSGTVSDQEVAERLRQAQIASPQAARYLSRWQYQRGLERRALSAEKVTSLVAGGALGVPDATERLRNLGYSLPDATLLLGQATARLRAAQAIAARQQASQAKRDQQALVSAQKSAQAAIRSAAAQLRNITPLATLKRWYCLGIRKGDWIRARLLAIGEDATASDAYLQQWSLECEQGPLSEAPAVRTNEQLVRRQTSLATLKEWWQNGITTDEWTRRRLVYSGYTPDVIDRYLSSWQASLGKRPGPAQAGAPTQA